MTAFRPIRLASYIAMSASGEGRHRFSRNGEGGSDAQGRMNGMSSAVNRFGCATTDFPYLSRLVEAVQSRQENQNLIATYPPTVSLAARIDRYGPRPR